VTEPSNTHRGNGVEAQGGYGYRPDIDGLRAVAVLSVLFFHAGLPPFSGGFVGVDIFFVISGYLITSIIIEDIKRDRFSIGRFYERRVRRIFPALYLTVLVTVAGALALFSAMDLERLFESVSWLAFFGSNFYFADNSGYFDGSSEYSAILQTWSLAIEEQFYVLFPPLLLFLSMQKRVDSKWVLLALCVVSLSISIYLVDRDARPAFFSTAGRVWELLVGALISVGIFPAVCEARTRSTIAWVGIVLMLGSVFLLSRDTPFPGAFSVPVCVGTAAVIWSGSSGLTFVGQVLAWRPLVQVGLISYSLYLLHWPILVFARYWNHGELSSLQTIISLTLAFGGAWVSYRFVETPLRKPKNGVPRRVVFGSAVLLMSGLAMVGGAGMVWQGGRYSDAEKTIAAETKQALAERCMLRDTETFESWPSEHCELSGTGSAIAIWGDSFAAHYFSGFRERAIRLKSPMMFLAESSCPPIDGLKIPNRPGCASFNQGVMSFLALRRPSTVVLSADWMVYEKKKTLDEMFVDKFFLLSETIRKLRENGSRVIVIGPTPIFLAPAAQIAASAGDDGVETANASYSRKFDLFFRELSKRGVIDYFPAYELFCRDAAICRFRDGRELLFWDTGHMTKRGSDSVLAALLKSMPSLSKSVEGEK